MTWRSAIASLAGKVLGIAILWIGLQAAPAMAAPVYLDALVNGASAGVTSFEQRGGDLYIAPAALGALGLGGRLRGATPLDADGLTPLSSLRGVTYSLDMASQAVSISAAADAMTGQQLRATSDSALPDRPDWGGLVNYSYYALASRGTRTQVSGYGEVRVFGPLGAGSTSFVARSDGGGPGGGGKLQRLDSALMFDNVKGMSRTIVGDFISSSLPWTRSVRAGGFSIATDFGLQPNLVTAPMPKIAGANAVPTTVDLYVDNVKRFSAGAKAGPFAISDLPMMDGRGNVSVVVTDTLGRQTVQSFSFYAASELLRPGLSAYALEGGFLRENYASRDDRYTDGFISGAYRRGLSDRITLEAQVDASSQVQTAGVGLVAKGGEEALFSAAFRATSKGAGQVYASARRDTRNYSLFASVLYSTAGFRDLASTTEDSMIRRAVQVGASIVTRWGQIAASYNRVATDQVGDNGWHTKRADTQLLGLNWSHGFGRANLYANAFLSRGSSTSKIVTVGFSLPFGRGGSAGATASSDGDHLQATANAAQAPPMAGGFGWRAAATADNRADASRLEGEVRHVSSWGEVGVGATAANNGRDLGARVYGSGAMLFLGEAKPRFAGSVGDGFALVETGAPNVEITVENVSAGVTGADGKLFLPRLTPLVASRVAVRAESVDLDREITVPLLEVRPARHGGSVVRMPLRVVKGVTVQIVTPDGKAVAAGSDLFIDGEARARVGYEGIAYIIDVKGPARAVIAGSNSNCFVEIPNVDNTAPGATVGPLVCRSESSAPRQFADRRPDPQPDRNQRPGPELLSGDVAPELRPIRSNFGF